MRMVSIYSYMVLVVVTDEGNDRKFIVFILREDGFFDEQQGPLIFVFSYILPNFGCSRDQDNY